jgi:hypothetical protein
MYNEQEMAQFMRIAMAVNRKRYPNEMQRISICSVMYREFIKRKSKKKPNGLG